MTSTASITTDADDWRELALCAEIDPELFYPEPGHSPAAAKRICAGCDVRVQCLEFALTVEDCHGVWGGTTPRERSRLRRGSGCSHPGRRVELRGECGRGHSLSGDNVRLRGDGYRACRACAREHKLASRGRAA